MASRTRKMKLRVKKRGKEMSGKVIGLNYSIALFLNLALYQLFLIVPVNLLCSALLLCFEAFFSVKAKFRFFFLSFLAFFVLIHNSFSSY